MACACWCCFDGDGGESEWYTMARLVHSSPRVSCNVQRPRPFDQGPVFLRCLLSLRRLTKPAIASGGVFVKRLASIIILGCSLLSGCYHYIPVANTALAPGTLVSVNVSTRGAERLSPSLGTSVSVLDGAIVSTNGDGMTLALQSIRRRGELQPSSWAGEPITLAADDVAQVQERRLSRGRTIAASTALVAGAIGVIIAIAKASGNASGGPGGRPVPKSITSFDSQTSRGGPVWTAPSR